MKKTKLDYGLVPQKYVESVRMWIERGEYPGEFVTSVLENNLVSTVITADRDSIDHIRDMVEFLLSQAPRECWGSREKMTLWHKDKLQAINS